MFIITFLLISIFNMKHLLKLITTINLNTNKQVSSPISSFAACSVMLLENDAHVLRTSLTRRGVRLQTLSLSLQLHVSSLVLETPFTKRWSSLCGENVGMSVCLVRFCETFAVQATVQFYSTPSDQLESGIQERVQMTGTISSWNPEISSCFKY